MKIVPLLRFDSPGGSGVELVRLVTYIELVMRRVWAKKGILFGSFLGATVVIALLVVVPLYEASVQAVDLKFSVENALEHETTVSAFTVLNQYSERAADNNRGLVAEAQDMWLQPWYPTTVERSQSREFLVIPSGPGAFVDFIALGEQWKIDTETGTAGSGSPPFPVPPAEATQVRLFMSPNLEAQLSIVEGKYDATTSMDPSSYDPMPLMIGEDVARLTRMSVGDRFFLKPFSGLAEIFEWVEVVAVVRPADPNDSIWGLDDPSKMVYLDQASFNFRLAALAMDSDVDPWGREFRGLPDTAVTQRWNLPLEETAVELTTLEDLQSGLGQFRAQIARESRGSIAASSPITVLIDSFLVRSVVIGGPILAMLALIVSGAIYFLVYTAAMTVEREGAEMALLMSRGASRSQTVGIHVGQSFVVAAVAIAISPTVARFLVSMTGRIPPFSSLTGGRALEVAQVRSIVPFLIAGGIIAFISMAVAVLPYARRSILALRSLATRPATKSVWQQYNIDIFAIALSLVLLAQLRLRGFFDSSSGETRLDPLSIVFPALMLFAGALVLLRVFPYVLKFVGWLLTKPRNLSMALTGWHLGRNPVPYGRLALLVWVTTGLAAFALTYAATLDTSYADRADFAAGADVRIVGDAAGYAVAPEGSFGTPVLRTVGAASGSRRRAEVLAVDPAGFSQVIKWREDFGAATPQDIFLKLRPGGVDPDVGVPIPQDAVAVEVEAVVVPQSLRVQSEQQDHDTRDYQLLMRIVDARYRVWTMVADVPFTDSEWRTARIDLSTGRNAEFLDPPQPPLSILSMWVERPDSGTGFVVDGADILIASYVAVLPGGSVVLATSDLVGMDDLVIERDGSAALAAERLYAAVPPGEPAPTRDDITSSKLWRDGTVDVWRLPSSRTRANVNVPQAREVPPDIPILVDREAAAIAGLNVDDVLTFSIGSQLVSGEVVGFLTTVPTATDPQREGVMVIDLAIYNVWTNGSANWSLIGGPAAAEAPGELWVSTDDPDATVRIVSAQMADEPDRVWTVGLVAAAFSSRPVQVGLVAILFVGAATGVVLVVAGVTGYVLVAVSRRAREMGVLRALGFERASVGFTFALEQLVVIGLGAAIGVLGGVGLVIVLLPFLQLGESASVIHPSVLLDVPVSQLLGYLALVGTLLLVSVLWATRRVSAGQMSEVLREVER